MKSVRLAASLLAFPGLLLSASAAEDRPLYHNPVLRGDYPDPSVIRVGGDYYATSTSSEWAPQFPLLHSKDLVNWQVTGAVFPEPPGWASGNFWAPEICEWKGKYFVYYTARKTDGPLAVAVATAGHPQGPWTDHGPLVAQDAGSIDGMAIDDENGQRWLVWKEDGNSRKLPTILWARQLDASGTKLTGESHEVMRNDAAWEGAVVEGPFILKRGDWFYLFYAGNSCCGSRAEYAEGVARSKKLLGPWEKCPQNPLIGTNAAFRAPGHGSIVDDPSGRLWLLYHSYTLPAVPFTGREMMLDEVTFGEGGWPVVNGGKGPSSSAASPLGAVHRRGELRFTDEFSSAVLQPGWQWPVRNRPDIQADAAGGRLTLKSMGDSPAMVARSVTSADFTATVVLEQLTPGSAAGISACGDPGNYVSLEYTGSEAAVWQTRQGERRQLARAGFPARGPLHLRMSVTAGHQLRFAASADGNDWSSVGEGDGGFLPPWDRAIRVALIAKGEARFDQITILPAGK